MREPVRLSCSTLSCPLTPCSVNNDFAHHKVYVRAEIIYSTVHAHHKVLMWSQATLCGTPAWALSWKLWLLLHWGYVGVTSWSRYTRLCYGYVMATLWFCYGCCSGCHASQERINAPVVPTAPHIFFQPLSSRLAYHRFSKQCTQWDTERRLALEQDQQYRWDKEVGGRLKREEIYVYT